MADNFSPVSELAERYANALFDLADDDNALAAIETDVGRVAALIEESEDFQRFIKSPLYSSDEQMRTMSAILEKDGIGGLVGNFFKVIAANRRLFAVPAIIKAFRQTVARHRGEVTADVTSAEPLSDAHIAALKAALKESIGKDVSVDARIDPSLLGGLIVRVGSRMVDSSLRTKLNALKLAMKEVG